MESSATATRSELQLGSHGEGYCRRCHYIEPLTPRGYLAEHRPGTALRGALAEVCPGSYRKPSPLPSGDVEAIAFTFEGDTAICPECLVAAPVDRATPRKFAWHGTGIRRDYCNGVGRAVGRRKVTLAER